MLKAIYVPDLAYSIDLPVFSYSKTEDEFIHEYETEENELVRLSYSFESVMQDKEWLVFSTNRKGSFYQINKSDLLSDLKVLKVD